MSATPERHQYANGETFYLVPCYECGVVLNSGHHYPEVVVDGPVGEHVAPSRHAVRVAVAHNVAEHATPDERKLVELEHRYDFALGNLGSRDQSRLLDELLPIREAVTGTRDARGARQALAEKGLVR